MVNKFGQWPPPPFRAMSERKHFFWCRSSLSHPSNNARCWTFFFAERSCVYSLNFLLRRRRIALQGATSVVVALISHNCHKKNTGKYIWLKFATRKTAGNISYHGTFYAGWCLGQVEFLFNYQWVRIKDFFLILLHWAHLIVGFFLWLRQNILFSIGGGLDRGLTSKMGSHVSVLTSKAIHS